MSKQKREISDWRLMLVGTFSVTFRRVFLIALAVLSLVVWTVTVIGLGVLRSSHGAGPAPNAVQAATPAPATTGAEEGPKVRQETHAAQQAVASPVRPAAVIELPARDPFLPADEYFPVQRLATAAHDGPLAAQEEAERYKDLPGLAATELVKLRLEAALLLGRQTVAIVRGNMFELDGQTLLVMGDEIRKQYRGGQLEIKAGKMRNEVRVGDTTEVRPVVRVAGRYCIGEPPQVFRVTEITEKKVVLTGSGKRYELEMDE